MQDYRKLYIDGAWVDPAGTETIDVINAATEEVMGSIPAGTAADIDRAVAAAKAAFESWSTTSVADRVKFVKQDLFKTDISQATVLTMYLLPNTVNMLSDKLQTELRPGTRIISHDYGLSGWIPEETRQFDLEDKVKISGVTTTIIYLYVVPAKVAGAWSAKVLPAASKQPVTFELTQQMQKIGGMAKVGGREVPVEDAKLVGEKISFRLPVERGRTLTFSGNVKGSAIEGTVEAGGVRSPWTAALSK